MGKIAPTDGGQRSLNSQILHLAVPNLISNITVPLLGAVDLAMMGRINSLTAMGAISLGAMIFNFIYWSLGFLRMGTCGFTAQAFGAKRLDESALILFRALFIALCGSMLLWILQTPILKVALWAASPEAELAETTARYFRIRIWAAPATVASFAFAGWFIGMQDSRTPMWTAILINIANIGFNYLFVFVYRLGSEGVALGTVLAQYTGLLFYLGFAYKKLRPHRRLWNWKQVWNASAMKRFLNVNSDIFLRTLLIILVFAFFTAQSSRFGNETLVLNTLLYQFFIFYSFAMDGFAHAAEALCGKFTGSGQQAEKKRTVKQVFVWGAGIALAFTLAYALFFGGILRLFTQDAVILEMSRTYYAWILGITLIGFPAFLWDGVYAGSLASRAMLLTMGIATLGFFALFYLFRTPLQNHAIWLAMTGFLVLRGLTMGAWWRKVI
ncbi:MAG: MATE family efflux transporter [Bacteroides sp.]|nr:MATE family efflux transporter [Ruminococcus flavefaciens]MCM1554717.1 MATE family efflux transporter [Bacteroides sp.]